VPSARVYFSQRSGELLWVDGGGTALAPSAGSELATVIAFFERYPYLYRLDAPAQAIRMGWNGGPKQAPPARGGLRTFRFEQYAENHPLYGKYGVAVFDPSGALRALQTRLVPSGELPAASGVGSTSQGLTVEEEPSRGRGWPRLVRRRSLEVRPGGVGRVIEETVERDGISVRRTIRDARGAVLEVGDETPSTLAPAPTGWQDSGQLASVPATDALGGALSIPSTRAAGLLVLGFRLEGIHAAGAAVSISDSGTLPDRRVIGEAPIATDAADWSSEAAFAAGLRDSARLATNLEATLRWYRDRLGWASWDGQGAPFFAAIRGNRSGSGAPDENAYGGGGYLLVGDGRTATGQPLSDALEVVAHEFTHSVINATADFAYRFESGALNESLCDFLGVAAAGFASNVYGESVQYSHARDLLDPASRGQPSSYSEFEDLPASDDRGGVHLNSGIMNRALMLAARAGGDPFEVAALAFDSLQDYAFAADTSLEEFAAGLSAYCSARGSSTCARLESAFRETELLRHFSEMDQTPSR
jgi:hypothetical protein